LLIQIGDKKYLGNGMDVTALQKVSNDVVKIVVRFDDYFGESGQDPRRYLFVKKGSLDNKKFIVETENGERLQVR
jgi:hypothetical protein